ncbi:glycoside hydrolase family 3 N-terminal domain-containing protein [Vibrio salinus]|uniref:glycoside hydrolase family 3 N-terminal domain-containing protein n=1 Tax=Vibrio salinus TaxID=2899784 RepID=UPI001E2EC561|nr:glycoside hydrolase family 3 N-terminal domain-containing protein [Vibrio salinus]MCE0495199.1 glycoside hydrolase family 3 C-terminal domain-containing protein [Vibrio salinus]
MQTYKNPAASIEDRVTDLLSRMTLQEKIAQMGAQWLILDKNGNHRERDLEMATEHNKPSFREKVSSGLGQITRPLGTHPVPASQGVAALNELQRYLVEETRLGIPAMPHEECLVGLMAKGATLFPSSLNYGHTWNPDLIESVGKEIAIQLKRVGARQGLAPVLDVSRDVRWGRTEETLGEDPYLVGVLATHYVKGLQGKDRSIYATLKHYVGHSFSEGARNHAPVHIGFKELNDLFLLPFEMAVKLGHAGSVMPAYHDIDNEPCHASYHLLTEILRQQWGFDGLIVADYGGVELLFSHHAIASDRAHAAALAFNAGLDIELPDDACAATLNEALEKNLISENKIDEIVNRILTHKFRLGLFEHPYTPIPENDLPSEKARNLAYQVAAESIVLLKNNGILPLNKTIRLALIGATADDQLAMLGGYSFPVHLILSSLSSKDKVATTVKEALETHFSHIKYRKGCDILTKRQAGAPVFPGDVDLAISQTQTSPISQDTSGIAETDSILNDCEAAIVCVGDLAGLFQTGTVGEGSDTDSLTLPGVQQILLDHALDSGKPVIVLVTGGRPYHLGRAEEEAAAILYGWAPGQEGARAVADILCGELNPSGKLTLSFPKSAGAVPYYYNHKLKSGGTPIAYHFGSRYNFGFGLSYTSFDYSDFSITETDVAQTDTINITMTISNTGHYQGADVVQLYVRDQHATLVRPIRELKGFAKVTLKPGEQRRLHFALPVDMLNFTNHQHQRIVEPGSFELMIGRSSADIVFRDVVKVTGKPRILPENWRMICHTRCD